MGQPKLALPIPGHGLTVLEHVLRTLRDGGVTLTLVVLAPHTTALLPLAQAAASQVLQLPQATSDMRSSVEEGLLWLEQQCHPNPEDLWLLLPADQAWISHGVIQQLLQAQDEHRGHSIFVPTHTGRRGHPTLFKWELVSALRSHPAGEGINAFVRCQAVLTWEVPAQDPGVLQDVDTPADYERLLDTMSKAVQQQEDPGPDKPEGRC